MAPFVIVACLFEHVSFGPVVDVTAPHSPLGDLEGGLARVWQPSHLESLGNKCRSVVGKYSMGFTYYRDRVTCGVVAYSVIH